MSDFLLLSEAQMRRIEPYSRCRTVFRASMTGASSVGSSLSSAMDCAGATRRRTMARTRRSIIVPSGGEGLECSLGF